MRSGSVDSNHTKLHNVPMELLTKPHSTLAFSVSNTLIPLDSVSIA